MDQQAIGKFISHCRKERGLTQVQLAEMLGVSDKSISRWENGKTMPDISLYEALCSALCIQVSELLYAKKLADSEKIEQGEHSALQLFRTKSQLKTFGVFTEILVFLGIIITITFTKVLASTTLEILITLVSGCIVWGFGLLLKIKIRKAIAELEEQ